MNLAHIRNFVTVAEHGGLRAAARALNMTQPALTRSISRLEEELAVPLLQRSVRGVILTPYGTAFLQRARAIWSEVGRVRDEMVQMRGKREGTVSIGVSFAAATLLVPPALRSFLRTHPNVRIHMVNEPIGLALADLRQGRLDFVVAPLPAAPLGKEVQSRPLFLNEIVIAVRKGHPKANAASLAELTDQLWALSGPGTIIVEAFASAGLPPPNIALTHESFLGLNQLIAETDLVGTMPMQLFAGYHRRNSLVQVKVKDRLKPLRVSLISRADTPLTPVASTLATLIQRVARKFA
jgi:DNA-binding transcriptional LysR family regulator